MSRRLKIPHVRVWKQSQLHGIRPFHRREDLIKEKEKLMGREINKIVLNLSRGETSGRKRRGEGPGGVLTCHLRGDGL